jgi:hypothetical protein
MKSSKIMISVAFAAFVLSTSAFAQTGAIRVSVPFDFTVGRQTLAAGDYRVTINGTSLLQVARIDGPGVASVSTNYTGGGPYQDLTPRLVFHCYGNRHFLSAAWIGEVNMGHELFASSAELEYARTTKQEQTIVLASRLPGKK